MKLRLLSLLLLISGVVHGQTPAGYIKANMRFKWTAGIFDSALHVPQYNGTPSGIRNGAWVGDGAVAVDTVNNLFYFRSSGAWHQTSSGAGWLLTGNSGTTSSNFIGTTDNQPLSFRVNNRWAGRIYTNGSVFIGDSSGVNNSALNNAGFGRYSLYNNTTGSYNTGSGAYSLYGNTTGGDNTGSGAYSLYSNTSGEGNTGSGAYSLYSNIDGELNTGSGLNSLYNNTTGWGNTGSGVYSLYSNTSGEGNTGSGVYSLRSNTTGSNNTGSGVYSLRSNTTGSNNTGMGYAAGYDDKQKVDAKNQILIGANTYGTRDSIAVIGASFMKETILRGKLIDSTLSAGAGTKAVRWNDATGEFTYDTTPISLIFGAGSNADADTTAFTTAAIYGSFFNDSDTLYVQSMRAVLQGTSPNITYKVWFNDSLNVEAGATALVTSGSSVTNTTTGTNVTSFDVTKIPPGVWVWVKTSTVTTKPKYFSLTINAKR
jgi:hypothetical protein